MAFGCTPTHRRLAVFSQRAVADPNDSDQDGVRLALLIIEVDECLFKVIKAVRAVVGSDHTQLVVVLPSTP